ncbi:sodium:calcium antiporter [Helicovermis profundi]|uniref:Sodium:calcium antiporter n=1 Tax=Helicovermis profundi TaxID=3065157 RepID=A0AAU9EC27_9FIRM|nr:sodium:calcium antiporter [Clostridia bacterium S502]
MFNFINNIYIAIVVIIIMSWIVSVASDKLGDVLHVLGIKLNIPTTVRGATFDAIASSFPEFATAMIAVLIYKEFTDVGVPTIAGSGIFNVLLIPMFSIIAFKGALALKVDKKNIYRDMFFYILALTVLGSFMFLGQFTYITGLVLLLVYVGYIVFLHRQTLEHRANGNSVEEEEDDDDDDMSYFAILGWIIVTMAFVWISVDAIIASAGVVALTFGIPKFITSVIIIAAATSIPDTLLSVKSAKKGDADGAISNAVGSNIFDICICLGFPMLIAGRAIPVEFARNIGMLIFLVVSMLVTGGILLKKSGVKKHDVYIMGTSYFAFLVYIVGIALGKWG